MHKSGVRKRSASTDAGDARTYYEERSAETKRAFHQMMEEHVRVFHANRKDVVVETAVRRLQNAMRFVHSTTRVAEARDVEAFRRRAQRDVHLFRYVLDVNDSKVVVTSRLVYLIQLDNTGQPLKTCLDWNVIDATLEVDTTPLYTIDGMRHLIDFADRVHDIKVRGVTPQLTQHQNAHVYHAFVSMLMAYICEHVTFFEEQSLPDYEPCPYQLIHQFVARKMYTNTMESGGGESE